MSLTAKNPIMPGFYPDPSICAVGADYYLINSTFAYFPGLPVMHSRDLVHWEQLGNAMDRSSQLPLEGCGHSEGLFAPTIRYHDGTFYVICTNVSGGGNFIITADKPEGPWSEPYYIEGADGIDPSLFFDGDGTCYYIGTHPNPEGCRYDGDWYIWIQELDIREMKLVGTPRDVWNGAMKNIVWPEGPHLYKKDGYYYILHAEGGTGPEHAVAVCRSRNIWGPYENNFCNPILTHRHLGMNCPVRYVGHADLFETPAGEWYMVMLAVRPLEGYTTMGRETFLAKVVWEKDWPVVNPGVGMLTQEVEIGLPEWNPLREETSFTFQNPGKSCVPGSSRHYDFTRMEALGNEFLFLRNPDADMYRLEAGRGLYLKCQSAALTDKASPSYVAVRQQHHSFCAKAGVRTEGMNRNAGGGWKAGLALLQNDEYHLRLELSAGQAAAILCEKGIEHVIGIKAVTDRQPVLILKVDGLRAALAVQEGEEIFVLVRDVGIQGLSTEVAGGFVGCTVGMYAMAENAGAKAHPTQENRAGEVCFCSFSYEA